MNFSVSSPRKPRLLDATVSYLAAGQFGLHAQAKFAADFRMSYGSASVGDRFEVAKMLSNVRSVPLEVISLLCCDDESVAAPILTHSPLLSEMDLTTQILQGTMLERKAIAQRKDLSAVLVSQLLSFGEEQVAQALLSNDGLPFIARRLIERIERLANSALQRDRETTAFQDAQAHDNAGQLETDSSGQADMKQKNNDLDDLGSSMKQGWGAQQQPTSLSGSLREEGSDNQTAMPAAKEHDALGSSETMMSQEQSEPLIDDEDIALLSKLQASDWEQLDDRAIEALAERLAVEEMRESGLDLPEEALLTDIEDDQIDANRSADGDYAASGSFRIGALDAINAPIPPLEVSDLSGRAAMIKFGGEATGFDAPTDAIDQDAGALSKTLSSDAAATSAVSGPTEKDGVAGNDLVPEHLQQAATEEKAPLVSSLLRSEEETRILADEAIAALRAIAQAGARTNKTGANAQAPEEQRKPQITLTVRKGKAVPPEQTHTEPAQASRISLSSTAEDDWQTALSRLKAEYLPGEPQPSAPRKTDPATDTTASLASTAPQTLTSQSSQSSQSLQVASIEAKETGRSSQLVHSEPLIQEHAPMGFMPDMISLSDLDLVEAIPDLPSATELMLQHQQRAIPIVELVEPVELAFMEGDKMVTLEEAENTQMLVVAEQLAAQREAAHAVLASVTGDALEQKAPNAPAAMDQDLDLADNLTDLPAMIEHRVVDVETYNDLRAEETSSSAENGIETEIDIAPGWRTPTELTSVISSLQTGDGIADVFYDYDAETRLTLLQTVIANTLVEAAQVTDNLQQRTMLDEETSRALVMARFGNDRILVSDMLHDISGHRRLDMSRLLQDKGGEALVVYLYHIGMDESSTLSMLLHGPDAIAHDYEKVAQLMTLYHQLYPAAAAKLVDQLFGAPLRQSGIHQPVHDDGAGLKSPRYRATGLRDSASSHTPSRAQTAPSFGRRTSKPE